MRKDFIVRENLFSKNPDVNFAIRQANFEACLEALHRVLPGYFFYRGGHHLAVHATPLSDIRLLMIEIR